MKTNSLRMTAIVLFACIVLFSSLWGNSAFIRGGHTSASDMNNHFGAVQADYTEDNARGGQSLNGLDHLHAALPVEGMLSSESRNISFVKNGRSGEETSEAVVFLLSIFLSLSGLRLLIDSRVWSAVISVCMEFLDYAMHLVHILQLRDGKKDNFSYSNYEHE